jgi:hypothetical protein
VDGYLHLQDGHDHDSGRIRGVRGSKGGTISLGISIELCNGTTFGGKKRLGREIEEPILF